MYAKRSFGQNYLIDERCIDRIVASLDLKVGETVVEIGAGRGALTEALLATGAIVVAIEIDRDLHPVLNERFGSLSNFQLIADDILQVDISGLFAQIGITPPAKLIGNLPYNISTAILQRVIDARELFSTAVFMFQREVVERITAVPGNSERGFFTVITESAFEAVNLFDVPPAAFSPRPKVWSSVVSLTPKPRSLGDDPKFRRLISMAFAQKRKTILNNLKQYSPKAEAALTASGIDPRRRAETLALAEWITLADAIK
ncbi:MAG: 16S rRNA (adenine(1518)-N(6)/adenine(1519)-N(6))-dimethyltransferase RsmA [Acidobacteriota bacterium]